MLDEILFMQIRLFRAFREQMNLSAHQANEVFSEYGIWEFIETCYDSLHLESDEAVLQDIHAKLATQGASL